MMTHMLIDAHASAWNVEPSDAGEMAHARALLLMLCRTPIANDMLAELLSTLTPSRVMQHTSPPVTDPAQWVTWRRTQLAAAHEPLSSHERTLRRLPLSYGPCRNPCHLVYAPAT
jgi:hypothetical protein